MTGRRNTHVAAVERKTSCAKRGENGARFEPLRFHLGIDGFSDLTDFVQIDAAICCRLRIQHADPPQQLKRTRSGRAGTVVAAVPDFDSIELAPNRTNHVDASERRMREHRNSAAAVYSIHQVFHIHEAYPPRDSVSENVEFASVKSGLQAGDVDGR